MWHPQYCDEGVELSASKVAAKQRMPRMSTLLAVPLAKAPATPDLHELEVKSPLESKRFFEIEIGANRGAVFVENHLDEDQNSSRDLNLFPHLSFSQNDVYRSLGWVESNIVGKTPLNLPLGIGCYPGTYAIDSYSGSIGTSGKWRGFADRKFRNGDVITTEIDLLSGTISYWINGSPLGIAFTGLDCTKSYYASVSIKFNRTKIAAHFDSTSIRVLSQLIQQYCLAELGLPLADWSPTQKQAHLAIANVNTAHNETILFCSLPNESLLEIFSYLSAGQLLRVMRVCRRFAHVGVDDRLWALILRRQYELDFKGDLSSELLPDNIVFQRESISESPTSTFTMARKNASPLIRKYQLKSNWCQGNAIKAARYFLHEREKPSALQMDSSLLVVAAGKRLEFLDSQRRCRIGTFNLKSRSGELSRASPVDSSSSLNYVNSSTGMKVMDYEILSLCFDDTNLVTAGARGFFTLLDLDTAQVLWSIQAHKERDVETVHFRRGQRLFATGGWDGAIRGWDIEEARNIFKIHKAHSKGLESGYVATLKWTPEQLSEYGILSGGYDGRLRLFDVRSPGGAMAEVRHDGTIVNDIAFSPMGNTVAVSCYNAGVMVYDLRMFAEGREAFVLQVREQPKPRCLHFDGHFLVSAGFSHNIVGWDTLENRFLFSFNSRQVLAMGADETQLVVGDDAGRLTFYDFSEPPSWSINALSYYTER